MRVFHEPLLSPYESFWVACVIRVVELHPDKRFHHSCRWAVPNPQTPTLPVRASPGPRENNIHLYILIKETELQDLRNSPKPIFFAGVQSTRGFVASCAVIEITGWQPENAFADTFWGVPKIRVTTRLGSG